MTLVVMIESVLIHVVNDNCQIKWRYQTELLTKISFDGAEYQLGIGGIHSCESVTSHVIATR